MSSSTNERLAALEAIVTAQRAERHRATTARRRLRRRVGTASLAVALLLLPIVARGGSMVSFNDVPTSHPFFESIDALYNARIATGCGGGNFCPGATVTRGQMAAFLARGLGSSGLIGFNTEIDESAVETQLGVIAFKPGNVANGFAFVQLDVSLTAYTVDAGCPCELQYWLEDSDGFEVGPRMYMDIHGINAGDNEADGHVSLTGLDGVAETGVYNKYYLRAVRSVGTSDFTAYGVITATYVPFNNYGGGSGGVDTPPRP